MIQITNAAAKTLLAILGLVEETLQINNKTWGDLWLEARNLREPMAASQNPVTAAAGYVMTYEKPMEWVPAEVLLNALSKAMIDREQVAAPTMDLSGTILETIEEIIQSPFARQRLSSELMTSLRKALYDPSEAALKDLEGVEKELTCAACRVKLTNRELVSYGSDGNIFCAACLPPRYLRRPCGKHLDGYTIHFPEGRCHHCEAELRDAQVPPPPAPRTRPDFGGITLDRLAMAGEDMEELLDEDI